MEITGRVARQILLFSLLILIAPMVLFPEQLGMKLAGASLVYAVIELVYYGIVCFVLNRRFSWLRVAEAAGICLIYRLMLGAVFGLLIAALYSMHLTVSLTLGMSGYLPAILLHIAATPFILTPAVRSAIPSRESKGTPSIESSPVSVREHERPALSIAPEKNHSKPASRETRVRATTLPQVTRHDSPHAGGTADLNAFDRTTRYIGEDSSVQLAAVVDGEGLLLGHYERGTKVAEDVAPYSLLLSDTNTFVLRRAGWGPPEKIDVLLKDRRIVIAREASFVLMVLASRQIDDLLTIRINRGLELLRKYMSERYGRKQPVNVEKTYV